MSYKYFLLALFLFPLVSYGQTGDLTIFSESGDRFYLVLNGEQQNDAPQTNVRIEDLNQPYYSTRIIFENQKIPDIVKNLQVTDMTGVYMDVTYKIQRTGNKTDLNYFSMAAVAPKYVAPRDMYVMHYGHHGDHGNDNRSNDRYRHKGPYAMDPQSFSDAKATVKGASFNDAMLSTAKSILNNNYLTTDQVMEMCDVFSFEDAKLDFAKAAYIRTIDQANYFKVANVFSFASSKEDLNNFIAANSGGTVNVNNSKSRKEPRYKQPVPMDNGSFTTARETIKNGSFESTMLSTAKGIINNNYFTTDQVMELVGLFSFDDAKLDIAKTAYLRTVDRNNYFKVANALSFSSSKEDLNNFLAAQH